MQKRISVRLQARKKGSSSFIHESQSSDKSNWEISGEEWKQKIVEASQFNYDAGDGRYVAREDLMPKLPSGHPFFINKMRMWKKYGRTLKKLIQK
ncbi:MAG: hypothetical protein RLZZ507_3129 [Cyanobacteriota bacterium]|jgi:hypothetical protein